MWGISKRQVGGKNEVKVFIPQPQVWCIYASMEGQCSGLSPSSLQSSDLSPPLPLQTWGPSDILLLLASECFYCPLLVSFTPNHSLANISPFTDVSKFSPFECLAAFQSGMWLIVVDSRSGPRPKSIETTFCHWVAHVRREQHGLLTGELMEYW